MDVTISTVTGYRIMTPDCKTIISEHGPSELDHCRKLIANRKYDIETRTWSIGNVLQYVFEKDDADAS